MTANLGVALAMRGWRVCLVDADMAMANLSLVLGMQSSPITLHDVLLGESNIFDAIYDGPQGVKFVPSGLSLESYRRVDSERLESIVATLKPSFDFILLDAPAGIEKNVMSAISASDFVLLIATPDPPAIADMLKTKIITQRLNRKPLGVVLNMVRGEKGEISGNDAMRMLELPLYGSIPFDVEVRKSFLQEKIAPVVVRKPSSPASVSISKIADKLAGMNPDFSPTAPKRESLLSKLLSFFSRKK